MSEHALKWRHVTLADYNSTSRLHLFQRCHIATSAVRTDNFVSGRLLATPLLGSLWLCTNNPLRKSNENFPVNRWSRPGSSGRQAARRFTREFPFDFGAGYRCRVGLGPDFRSRRNLLYISVRAFSIANSIRVLKFTTEKVLETVKKKTRGKIKEFIRGDPPTRD